MSNFEIVIIFRQGGFSADRQTAADKAFYFDEGLYSRLRSEPYKALFYLGFERRRDEISGSLSFLQSIAARFIRQLLLNPDIQTDLSPIPLDEQQEYELLLSLPFVSGYEHITSAWLKNAFDGLTAAFREEVAAFAQSGGGGAEEFLKKHDGLNVYGKVYFHLVQNNAQNDVEKFPFAFLATYSSGGSHMPLKNALSEFEDSSDRLLKLLGAVSRAAGESDFISEMVESGELFSPLKFTAKEAYTFLREIPIYEKCGILCRIPNWWRKKGGGLSLKVSVGGTAPSLLGMDALLNVQPLLYLGQDQLTPGEARTLLEEAEGLSMLKGKWVEVDHAKLEATLAAYEKASRMAKDGLTIAEAMRLQLNPQGQLGMSAGDVAEVTNGEWLDSVRDRLLNPAKIESTFVGDEFCATLRHYQQTGFDWLKMMSELRFGALLADDMGLGKTVQILALLEHMRQSGRQFKALLVIPASLIGNWQKEAQKFAPNLKLRLLHTGSNFDPSEPCHAQLYITTYGMVVRQEALTSAKWDMVILDEAQAIKNPGTKQTRAIKQLQAPARIAMTGTPIENRLSDLWSLFDFLNGGLLGSAKEFSAFSKQLKEQGDYSRLKQVVSPFILRRSKTDKAVISDLPDKLEVKEYAALSKKQAALYKALVKQIATALEETQGIARKGLVLASIMKFKQICNHPDQYLGQSGFAPSASGKFELMQQICRTIYEKRERVLVFTQFKEMTMPIAKFLEGVFERPGLVLHGGTPVKKRSELVDQFCGQEYVPFMVLSLKAGGVGLNLTAANHVIHFDRWWNPATENQATDRAFRIGQQKDVMVYKFIAAGTIEEKIDEMIEVKQKMAGDIIGSGESWITELSNDELTKLFELGV